MQPSIAAPRSRRSGDPASGIPSLRGQDHTGITVPDPQAAIDFFVDVVRCELATRFGPFRDDTGSFMAGTLDVHPRAAIEQIALLRCGMGSNIELFQYSAPDQRTDIPKNSDIGGRHIAFHVDDIEAAVAHLKSRGVRVLAGPLPIIDGPAAGQTINYFLTPWGPQLELISYPHGMAYEAHGGTVLWSPKQPDRQRAPPIPAFPIPHPQRSSSCPISIAAASCKPAARPPWRRARSPDSGSRRRPMRRRSTR